MSERASTAILPHDSESSHAKDNVALQRPWRIRAHLSSMACGVERFLTQAGFDRAPWLAVVFMAGISLWFVLPTRMGWGVAAFCGVGVAVAAHLFWRHDDGRVHLRLALISVGLCLAAGIAVIWARSAMIGAPPLEHPMVAVLDGKILQRIEQPAQGRIRLVLATRHPQTAHAIKVRVNLPQEQMHDGLMEGAVIRVRARLMPPALPLLPGGYHFARRAWFDGLTATGSVLGDATILTPVSSGDFVSGLKRRLSAHVRTRLEGSAGAIAANLASGDQGAISEADYQAMRDSGLAHLMSISGLHVSAVIGATYMIALRILALSPWLALRMSVPLLALGMGALAGIAYTVLTGMHVPTVRSCLGALLVLAGVAMGRNPLSLRMLSVVALTILLLWPESLINPGFQMSFTAVMVLIALHQAQPIRQFLAHRDEHRLMRAWRSLAMLFLTALVIELALMPITLFHFHRGGVYGVIANVPAIPLMTFITMPLIALALLLDIAGIGAPVWYLAGLSIEWMLAIAHWTASQPGAVNRLPVMHSSVFLLFVAGGFWLALWQGRVRLWGALPIAAAILAVSFTKTPDILITGDGRQVGITGEADQLLLLRDSRSPYLRDNLLELAAAEGRPLMIDQWPGARCSQDFCTLSLQRDGRLWHILIARGRTNVAERALAAACERADIVVADRWLPRSCRPRWLKADKAMLRETGGLAITLSSENIRSVTQAEGEHGWWQPVKALSSRRSIKRPAGS